MADRPQQPVDEHENQRRADALFDEVQATIRAIDRADLHVLHELNDQLAVEIMIEHGNPARKRLLRALSDYCEERIHLRERKSGSERPPEDTVSNRIRLLVERGRRMFGH